MDFDGYMYEQLQLLQLMDTERNISLDQQKRYYIIFEKTILNHVKLINQK